MTADSAGAGARILVVDDDPGLLDLIEMRLMAGGYAVSCAASGEEALERFRAERPRLVISDLRMDGMDGHALFARLHAEAPTVPVIILTAHGTIPDAVAATQRGVFGFLTKPFDGRELLAKVAEAMAISPKVDASAGEDAGWRASIVSSSMVMEELLRQARRVADADDPVLISGQRGSGKELLARAIHAASRRAGKPFVVIRCAELADLKPGASPLARALTAARGGVLLLDDIEELPPVEQARLLPLVREHTFFSAPTRVDAPDIRIVATTTQALDQAIRDGRFRADLFYAIGRVALNMPALAERREDIPALVAHFVAQTHGAARGLAPEAMAALQEAAWPGNVRQLRSVVEQTLALAVTPQAPVTLVRRLLREETERETAALDEARRAFEYDYLVQLLDSTAGNVTHAARVAQRNRTEFYKLLARHKIDPGRYK
ncbi:MAG: sigma 54-interacting transcriptional regulator [Rhodocyclales bacterium]|nr:sigma 54-interacting transcriptional regulator [Rhodocyclales bacterium]